MASSMCGSDQVRCTKISVSCLQSSMVVGMSWSGAAGVLQVLESYISLRETWTPTCTVKFCSRAWSPPSRNWVARQCSSMTMTPNTPPRQPLLYWRGKGDGLAKHVTRLELYSTSLGDPQAEGRGVQSLKYPPTPRRCHGGVEEHSSGYLEALVNSIPRRVKVVLDNDGGHTKYWQLTWCMLKSTTFPKGCTHFCWQGFSF